MHFNHCEHPIRIFNKYLGKYIYVPCRKCNSCRNILTNQWAQRIQDEMKCHKYVYFFTLKYSDDFCPFLVHSPYEENTLLSMPVKEGNHEYNDMIKIKYEVRNEFEKDYYSSRQLFPYLRKRDFQLFMKRLRYYAKSIQETEQIRFVLCGEYGPTTFRCHAHGLLFFESDELAKKLHWLLHKAWTKGSISFRRCDGNDRAAGYVAKYVVRPADLPQIYFDREIRQFLLSSKCPPIGSYKIERKEVQEIFNSALPYRDSFISPKVSVLQLPLPRFLEDKIFPKIKDFDRISSVERIILYGIFERFNSLSWREFKRKVKSLCSKEFLYEIIQPYLIHEAGNEFYSLYNLYAKSRRVYENRIIFGVSLVEYVSKIETYYSNKNMFKLKQQLIYEDEYFKNGGKVSDLITMDKDLCHEIKSRVDSDMSLDDLIPIISQFDDLDIYLLDVYQDTMDLRDIKVTSKKIYKDSMKGKYANDFFTLDRFKTTLKHFSNG